MGTGCDLEVLVLPCVNRAPCKYLTCKSTPFGNSFQTFPFLLLLKTVMIPWQIVYSSTGQQNMFLLLFILFHNSNVKKNKLSFVVGPWKFKHFPPNTNFCLPASQSSCLATLVKTLHSEMLNSSKIDFKYSREIKCLNFSLICLLIIDRTIVTFLSREKNTIHLCQKPETRANKEVNNGPTNFICQLLSTYTWSVCF